MGGVVELGVELSPLDGGPVDDNGVGGRGIAGHQAQHQTDAYDERDEISE
jgi:hypothetical protein